MPYCTQDDILAQLPINDLIAQTDDEGFGEVDSTRVDAAIAGAGATIDSYCQGRYPLPLSPVPQVILSLCVDLAIYNLFTRRAVDDPPKVRESRKIDAIRFLEKVASGGILLGAATPAPSAGSLEATVSSPDRIFGRNDRRGF